MSVTTLLAALVALAVVMTGGATVWGAPAPPSGTTEATGRTAERNAARDARDAAEARAAEDAATLRQRRDELTGDITFSVPSGTFRGEVSVSLGTSVSGALIRYTTDGRLPTASSPVYSGPLRFTATTQLRARAFVDGAAAGEPGTALYVARSVDATHDLPLLVMDAYGGGKPGREYRDVATLLMDPNGGTTSLGAAPTVATRAGFHLRGQSSATFEKAPYRLELWDNDNEDADHPMLGMPADSDWVLRGPFPDKTLIRDAFAYSLGQELGLKAPRHRFVELYLNLDGQPLGADDYQGVYLLDETVKRSPDRIDIANLKKSELTEPAVTGGYIFKFDAFAAQEPKLPCTGDARTCWRDLEVVEPSAEDLRPEQQTWLARYVQRFHDALHGANPSDPQTGYPAYIDVDSFVDLIILNELSRQGDAYIRSQYFHKDRGGRIVAGPLWDYDLGFGAVPGSDMVQGWQFQPFSFPGFPATTDWFVKLMQDPSFNRKVKQRWDRLRQGVLSDAHLRSRVSRLAEPLTDAAQRNFRKWPNLGSRTVGPFQTKTSRTWQEQLQMMQDWLVQRAAWIDSSGWRVTAGPAAKPEARSAPVPPHLEGRARP
ncbi:CotH kinase family protein [Streptomyces macrosporus]|uniref:GH29D-like beta-sandwich domain-containing protein n=1 Tax=Streptomyces macrosporus TaxID=44032 RepID=A0ABN3JPJ4_9ACTN